MPWYVFIWNLSHAGPSILEVRDARPTSPQPTPLRSRTSPERRSLQRTHLGSFSTEINSPQHHCRRLQTYLQLFLISKMQIALKLYWNRVESVWYLVCNVLLYIINKSAFNLQSWTLEHCSAGCPRWWRKGIWNAAPMSTTIAPKRANWLNTTSPKSRTETAGRHHI